MKRKSIVIVLVVFCSFLNSYSQTNFYGRYTLGGKIEPAVTFTGKIRLNDKLNLTGFVLYEDYYSEALIGLSYSFTDWMKLGLSTGIEQKSTLYRFGGSCWLGSKNLSLLALLEQGLGKNNYWYKTSVDYQANESISLGLMAWRFHGIGPMMKYSFYKLGITLWAMPAYDPEIEAKRLMFGIQIKRV